MRSSCFNRCLLLSRLARAASTTRFSSTRQSPAPKDREPARGAHSERIANIACRDRLSGTVTRMIPWLSATKAATLIMVAIAVFLLPLLFALAEEFVQWPENEEPSISPIPSRMSLQVSFTRQAGKIRGSQCSAALAVGKPGQTASGCGCFAQSRDGRRGWLAVVTTALLE